MEKRKAIFIRPAIERLQQINRKIAKLRAEADALIVEIEAENALLQERIQRHAHLLDRLELEKSNRSEIAFAQLRAEDTSS